jgi:hypothetical protein
MRTQHIRLVALAAVTALSSCAAHSRGEAATAYAEAVPSSSPALITQGRAPAPNRAPRWRDRETVLQGFIGVTLIDELDRSGGSGPDVDASGIDTMPLIGGGAQLKLGGERVDLGVEAMLALNWRANAAAFTTGGGAVAVDVNLLVVEVYGGPFASMFLGDTWRAYVAAGPLVQFGRYDQDGGGIDDSGSGFGVGGYARTGLEYRWSNDTMVGIGARWFESEINLDSGLGDIDLSGGQVYLSLTRGF